MAIVAKETFLSEERPYRAEAPIHICHSYTGFSFGGRHCSQFGLIRVSNADRYTTGLLPQGEEKSIRVPGQDGSYYFGNTHKTKTIPLEIAFDKLTKEKLHKMQEWLSEETTNLLVLDEAPYKGYFAKCDSMQSISYVPFDEEENGVKQTFYKGRGTLNFTCYYPYAIGTIEFLDDLPDLTEGNGSWETEEWSAGLGIPNRESYNSISDGKIKVINCGDFPSYPYIRFSADFFSSINFKPPYHLYIERRQESAVPLTLFGIKVNFNSSLGGKPGGVYFNTQSKRFEYLEGNSVKIKFLTDDECWTEPLSGTYPQEDFYIPPQHLTPSGVWYTIKVVDKAAQTLMANGSITVENPYIFLT